MGPFSVEEVLAQEVEAIHGPAERLPNAEFHTFIATQTAATARANKDADVHTDKTEKADDIDRRKKFYCELNKLNRAALCLSGGGIRSATFCLGVIQSLAAHALKKIPGGAAPASGQQATDTAEKAPQKVVIDLAENANQSLLGLFHYLSTVSGGGYIGSWLSAWRTRDDFPTVWKNLTRRPEGPDSEPAELSWLRAYSNYLTRRVGLGSSDTWAAAAIFLRNLILNWLVIVPAVAVVLLGLKIAATFSVWIARDSAWGLPLVIAAIGVACLIVAQAFANAHRPTRRAPPPSPPAKDPGNIDQPAFWKHDLLWSVLSSVLVTSFLTSAVGAGFAYQMTTFPAIAIGAGLGVLVYAAGWLAGWPWRWECKDFASWAASGLIYGGLLGLGAHLYTLLHPYMGLKSVWIILIPMMLGVPWVLAAQLFAEMIFVGLVSYEVDSDADREWLGRRAGWMAAAAIIWALTAFLSLGGAHFLIEDAWGKYLAPYIASSGGIAGVIAAWIGKSSHTPAKADPKAPGAKAIASKIILAIAGPIFAAVLVVGISVALDLLLLDDSLVQGLVSHKWTTGYILLWLLIGLVVTFFIAWLASRSVNINRFSLHALYRNRLVRAYLGASRQARCPDNFTGFDIDDNLPVHELWPPKPVDPHKLESNTLRLFHVVNITLNVVQATRLAWQQRKAESFTVSPLHSGAAYKGFRYSKEYAAGSNGEGITLGTAMAISGAAASPNMGYHSSPSLTLLLALFNVRLGWWLGNPGKEGNDTYKEEGPTTAIRPLAEETFGLTTDEKPWVYLSDGGHFENLGLYEMVRRRCRVIIAIDAGCDPDFNYEDLGNAVRKIYIDQGIRITFDDLYKLQNRPERKDMETVAGEARDYVTAILDKSSNKTRTSENKSDSGIPYHAIGQIHYKEADGDGCEDGWVIYLKPAIHFSENEGAGVRSYANANDTFPHESTADQFFTESQFESYRSLGLDIMNQILRGANGNTVAKILAGLV